MALDEFFIRAQKEAINQGARPDQLEDLRVAHRLARRSFPLGQPSLEELGLEVVSEEVNPSKIPNGAAELLQKKETWFTEATLAMFNKAQEESMRLDHNYIGTEHLLLGLLPSSELELLIPANIQSRIDGAVRFIISPGGRNFYSDRGLTPRASKVVEFAADEARKQKLSQIDPTSLLLGLLREGEGIAAGVLESLGYTYPKVKDQIRQQAKS